MARSGAPRSVVSEARKLALAALQDKATFIERAAVTQHRVQQLLAELEQARREHGQSYRAAVEGGWTKRQLTELGISDTGSPIPARKMAPAADGDQAS